MPNLCTNSAFTDVSDASGVGKPESKGMGVVLADFMSQSDLRLHFGIGKAQKVDLIEVKWPTTHKL